MQVGQSSSPQSEELYCTKCISIFKAVELTLLHK